MKKARAALGELDVSYENSEENSDADEDEGQEHDDDGSLHLPGGFASGSLFLFLGFLLVG